jgi:galactose mutarotase-like enzyme
LFLDYQVKNIGAEDMYFSIGAHPAFNTPGDLEDYSLVFEKPEAIERQIISTGLRSNAIEKVELINNTLRLEKRLFEVDAIVAEGLNSNEITIVNKENEKVVSVRVQDFPYYGIWSKSPYPFICLEPWVGVADKEDATGELSEKEGIQRLESMEIFLRRIAFRFF